MTCNRLVSPPFRYPLRLMAVFLSLLGLLARGSALASSGGPVGANEFAVQECGLVRHSLVAEFSPRITLPAQFNATFDADDASGKLLFREVVPVSREGVISRVQVAPLDAMHWLSRVRSVKCRIDVPSESSVVCGPVPVDQGISLGVPQAEIVHKRAYVRVVSTHVITGSVVIARFSGERIFWRSMKNGSAATLPISGFDPQSFVLSQPVAASDSVLQLGIQGSVDPLYNLCLR